ncbi:phosphotransferase family protein [Metabacillus herbersteinensis]|uniref:Phosphotransferase family protein n=1 Tax=Metabacillus herbersteinensis TaxID=283816 RepID=A0ABV6GAG4_9BACI
MSLTIPVRKGEELNQAKLHSFLTEHFPNLPEWGPLSISQFGTGASNLTYELKVGEWEAVLRRPPLGPVAPKAHDMEREHAILADLNPLFPLAPKPLVFSKNEDIVGSPFFIMERKHGVLLDTDFPEGITATEELGKQVSEVMVDTLVALHNVPYQGTALEKLSKPEGFMERQVTGWIGRYHRAKTDEIGEVDLLTKWLETHIPHSGAPTVIHYDFKLNNALFTPELTEISGLFDWEMTTVGDPLADLGAAMGYWTESDDPELFRRGFGKPSVTTKPGFYTRKQFIESYAKKSGRDVSDMHFYLTFAYFKLAVICQQIYYRFRKGQTNDQRFLRYGAFVEILIQHALTVANEK